MNYKFLFLVGSAINQYNEKGAFTTEERFQQTLETLDSIKSKVPDSYILIYESSEIEIKQEFMQLFQNIEAIL